MEKKLHGLCAIAVSAAILLSTLTACGQKINGPGKSQNMPQGIQSADINPGEDTSGDNASPADSQIDFGGDTAGNFSGGSSSGGSSGGNSGGSSHKVTPDTPDAPTTQKNDNNPTDPTIPTSTTTKYVYDIQQVINNAPLNPMRTNDPELDQRIDEIFAEIITDDMTTYEKTRVLFDYLVQTNEYGYLVAVGTQTSYVSLYDVDVVTRAKTIFKYKRGTCIDFAAAFMCLTRRIGLNCYMVQGRITDLNGSTYHHGWNTIRVDGIDYTFDSQADFRVRQRDANGKTKFVNFGTYYPNVFLVQYVNLAVNTFKNFRTY